MSSRHDAIMPDMRPETSHQEVSNLSEEEYLQLRQELAQQLRQELRRSGRQHYFAMGLHALVLIILAVLLFISSQRYHDFMLWAVGLCLLLFSALEFLDLDYVQGGRSWLDIFQSDKDGDSTSP